MFTPASLSTCPLHSTMQDVIGPHSTKQLELSHSTLHWSGALQSKLQSQPASQA
jgi:hypothetical protein